MLDIHLTADIPMPQPRRPHADWSWIRDLEVGQSGAVPIVERRRLSAACYHEHKRTGRTFIGQERMEDGQEVWRVWRQS